MQKIIKIEGMMCPHCEKSVRKALEAVPGVREAVVSHTAGTAVVSLDDAVENSILKQAVEAADFRVLNIE